MFCVVPYGNCDYLNVLSDSETSRSRHEKENKPYIKKPPNAFMLFMREQRPNVELEVKCKGSGAVNVVLAQKVSVLSVSVTNIFHQMENSFVESHLHINPQMHL